jgi:1-acyl-sn-glycerol-3-phosphate acyltransferase
MVRNIAVTLVIALSNDMDINSLTTDDKASVQAGFVNPHAYQFRGSRMARGLLRLLGWHVYFEGFPTLQGVAVVYPHTSNWDAPVMFLAKWVCGVQVMFWGKESLFRIPLLGAWLRWIGGVSVRRTAKEGVVGQAVSVIAEHKAKGEYFWLGLAPEGTRKYIPGWRSGFYQTAMHAQVPLCLVKLDYSRREISVRDFMVLSGDQTQDMAHIAAVYKGVRGLVPERMAPIQLLDAAVPRENTVVS